MGRAHWRVNLIGADQGYRAIAQPNVIDRQVLPPNRGSRQADDLKVSNARDNGLTVAAPWIKIDTIYLASFRV
jgi:hypothetical protein